MVDLSLHYDTGSICLDDDYIVDFSKSHAKSDAMEGFRDPKEAFLAAMVRDIGSAPKYIISNKFVRFAEQGRRNDDACYCKYFDDEFPGGVYGNFRTGEQFNWSVREVSELSPIERERFEQVKAEREKEAEAGRVKAAAAAKARWENAVPACADHPYLARKGIQAHGVREETGCLLVPISIEGALSSVQAIAADGSKKYHYGAPVTGGYFEIGAEGDTIVICEGFATGASIHEATGLPVLVAFMASNLEAIARLVRDNLPDAAIIIAGDDDYRTEKERGFNPGQRDGRKAADAVGATLAVPPFDRLNDGDAPSDWNDFASLRGIDAMREAFQAAQESGHPDREAELHGEQASGQQHADGDPLAGFIFDGDASLEPPPMLVKKLVPLDGICFIGGQSGAGKTFIAVYLAVMLASGGVFFGHKVVERVGVAIFAAEGASTIASRVTVARNHDAHGEILPIAWLGAVPNLADAKEVKAMVQRLRAVDARFRATHGVRLGAVICDTLAASFSLNDENDNSEAAKAIRAMKTMSDALGVVVLPVHHFGKTAETGLRGASAWRAGCDTVLSVLADRDQTTGACSNRRLALTKSRVGEEGWVAPFELRFVALGEDEDGEEFGACYVEQGRNDDGMSIISKPKEKGPPRAAKVYLDAFAIVIGDKGQKVRPFGHEGPEVVAVDREDIRDEFDPSWPTDGDTPEKRKDARRKAFDRGEEWALNNKRIATREVSDRQLVWLLKEAHQ
jgi:phage/plasmid primase-like uncharacterized protein